MFNSLSALRLRVIVGRGRFAEEYNLGVFMGDEYVMSIKLFLGRPPYYSCWVELYNIAQYVN